MPMRALTIVLGTILLFGLSSAAWAQCFQPVASPPAQANIPVTSQAEACTLPGPFPTLDGNGKTVGTVTNIVFTLIEEISSDHSIITLYVIDFDYYNGGVVNGNGSQGGYQEMDFTLLDKGGVTIVTPPLSAGLPRYQCWYHHPHHVQTGPGLLGRNNNCYDIAGTVTVNIPPVTGTQTGC
jgi:hypothetical protein